MHQDRREIVVVSWGEVEQALVQALVVHVAAPREQLGQLRQCADLVDHRGGVLGAARLRGVTSTAAAGVTASLLRLVVVVVMVKVISSSALKNPTEGWRRTGH